MLDVAVVRSSPAAIGFAARPTRTPYMMTSSPRWRGLALANLCLAGIFLGGVYVCPLNSIGSPAFKSGEGDQNVVAGIELEKRSRHGGQGRRSFDSPRLL